MLTQLVTNISKNVYKKASRQKTAADISTHKN